MNEKETMAQKKLESYVKNYKLFMDTSSLLTEQASKFWEHISPFLSQVQKKIIIPSRCVEEIDKHSQNTEKPDLANQARKARELLEILKQKGYIEIRGEKTDSYLADNVFNTVFTKFRLEYNLLLITQDRGLAADIKALNNTRSVRCKACLAVRINQYGYLSNITDPVQSPNTFVNISQIQPLSNNLIVEQNTFCTAKKVTDIPNEILGTEAVHRGEVLNSTLGQNIVLGDILASGGEGEVYATDTEYVAKIYFPYRNTIRRREKVKYMLEHPIKCRGICWPVAGLSNQEGEFVGYLMPRATGVTLNLKLFSSPKSTHFPKEWKKHDIVKLCIEILNRIAYLHKYNVLLGDINPKNILVDENQVFFVDTDSYQINDFPCEVGQNGFTAPEIHGESFSNFLRTLEQERFAVAVLLFMCMLPGKSPYTCTNGGTGADNFHERHFSYPLGEKRSERVPQGAWRYAWSHLSRELKECFWHTFHQEGKYYAPQNRPSEEQWLNVFNKYFELLMSGKLTEKDPMSDDIFPSRFKREANVEYTNCEICGQEIKKDWVKLGMCNNCANEGTMETCSKCGNLFTYTNFAKKKNGKSAREIKRLLCPHCREKEQQVRDIRFCQKCQEPFDIDAKAYDKDRVGVETLPTLCKECLKKENKKDNTTEKENEIW